MLNNEKIYILNKKQFMKKSDKSAYWYQIEYIYKDTKGNLQYNFEFISKEDFDNVVVSFDSRLLEDIPGYTFKGHYQQYKFKADVLVE